MKWVDDYFTKLFTMVEVTPEEKYVILSMTFDNLVRRYGDDLTQDQYIEATKVALSMAAEYYASEEKVRSIKEIAMLSVRHVKEEPLWNR